MKDIPHPVILLCVLMMSVCLIGFSIVWAVDIRGTVANDNIIGTATDDDIRGFRGNNILNGLSGSDEIQGEGGNDILNGSDGNDSFLAVMVPMFLMEAWVMMSSTEEMIAID